MFVKLNERVYLNLSRITRTKIENLVDTDGVIVKFFEGKEQVAKSKRFDSVVDADAWLQQFLMKA